MDTSKWKSVAVSHELYSKLQSMAEQNDRSVSKQLQHLIKLALQKEAA